MIFLRKSKCMSCGEWGVKLNKKVINKRDYGFNLNLICWSDEIEEWKFLKE